MFPTITVPSYFCFEGLWRLFPIGSFFFFFFFFTMETEGQFQGQSNMWINAGGFQAAPHAAHLTFNRYSPRSLPGLPTAELPTGLGRTKCSPTKKHTIYASYTLAISRHCHALLPEGKAVWFTGLLIITDVWKLLFLYIQRFVQGWLEPTAARPWSLPVCCATLDFPTNESESPETKTTNRFLSRK